MPLTDESLNYFKRYNKFYLQNDDKKVCWRVEAVDWISTPGILEITAVEYYANKSEDDLENGLVGALIAKKIDPNEGDLTQIISGETFIKPKKEYSYICNKIIPDGKWSFDKNYPIEIVNITRNAKGKSVITIKWNSSYTGQFELSFGQFKKTIVVESLF